MKRLFFSMLAAVLLGTSAVTASETDGELISSFSTKYNEKNKNRAANILLASEAINEVVIFPGEEFSFNDTIGQTTHENGYKEATVFYKNEKQKAYGGGVCQVSTTLYNAVEMAGMEVTERHSHSLEVTYIEEGRDATTSHRGELDFKFVNDRGCPVQIRVENEGGTITVKLLKFN